MRLVTHVAVALALASALIITSVGGATQDGPQGERISRKGTPLIALAKRGESHIVVVKDQAAPHFVEPPAGMGYLEWLTSLSDAVLVIRVHGLDPALRPSGDWITTSVDAQVEEILKAPSTGPSPGAQIQFVQDGGDMTIKGVHITAVVPWAEGFRSGHRYLVFGVVSDDQTLVIDSSAAFELTHSSTLEPLARRGKARSEANISATAAKERIALAMKQRQRH